MQRSHARTYIYRGCYFRDQHCMAQWLSSHVGWLGPSSGPGTTADTTTLPMQDKGMGGRYVDFLYTICRYIATIHTDIVDKLTRSVEIVSQKNGHYFLNQHYLYKDRLYLLVRQDLLK